jgi:hypothetical protein
MIKIEVLRPFHACGAVFSKAGAIVALPPADALLVLESGRGKLVNQADAQTLRELQKQPKAALKAEAHPPGGPWRPL